MPKAWLFPALTGPQVYAIRLSLHPCGHIDSTRPAPSRHFNFSREPEHYSGIVGIAFPVLNEFVGIGHGKRGGFVERKLPCSHILLRRDGQQFMTVFDLRGDYTVAICRDLKVHHAFNICDTRYGGIEW